MTDPLIRRAREMLIQAAADEDLHSVARWLKSTDEFAEFDDIRVSTAIRAIASALASRDESAGAHEPTAAMIEAGCQARCTIPGIRWDDGLTEGVARIEQMLVERQWAAMEAARVGEVGGARGCATID